MNQNPPPDPAQDWVDAFMRPLEILTTVAIIAGVVGVVLSMLLILARSPKGPRK